MTYADIGLGLIIVPALALCAYACVPHSSFPDPKSRVRWFFFFFLTFSAATAISKLSLHWISD
jgi:hypothetical protein